MVRTPLGRAADPERWRPSSCSWPARSRRSPRVRNSSSTAASSLTCRTDDARATVQRDSLDTVDHPLREHLPRVPQRHGRRSDDVDPRAEQPLDVGHRSTGRVSPMAQRTAQSGRAARISSRSPVAAMPVRRSNPASSPASRPILHALKTHTPVKLDTRRRRERPRSQSSHVPGADVSDPNPPQRPPPREQAARRRPPARTDSLEHVPGSRVAFTRAVGREPRWSRYCSVACWMIRVRRTSIACARAPASSGSSSVDLV